MPSDFAGAFAALRRILEKNSTGMVVLADTPTKYTVITRAIGPNKKPMWFGAVMSNKSAVSFHLLPLYYNPKLKASVAPELLPRLQGKACFNFQRPDPDLFKRLDQLTRLGREQWKKFGFLEPGPVSAERLAAAVKSAGVDSEQLARLRHQVLARAAKKRAATAAKKKTEPRTKTRATATKSRTAARGRSSR